MKRSVKTILSLAVVGIGLVLTPAFSGPGSSLQAETLSISQIDASSLLLSQEVDLYISVTDERARSVEGLTRENFQVFESADGTEYKPVPEIKTLEEKPNKKQGIHIMLLIDNSGSMYDTLSGAPTEEPGEMRITHAKQAIRRFINRAFNPRDVISLSSFNTTVTLHSEALKDPSALEGLLESIERPEREQAYTELYHALEDSSLELAGYRGRKVVVVLSDGENYPYVVHAGKPHPEYGRETLSPEEVVQSYQMEGITLYAIHFGIDRDLNLSDIARETGGAVYDARNEEELASVYLDIKEKIENEYRLTYRASMIPTERKYVKVEYERGAQRSSSERYYYAGTIFGIPLSPYPHLILLLTAAAVLIWIVLLLIRYHKKSATATLEVLQPGYRTTVSSMTIPLTQDKTVIGGGEQADLTISGLSSVKPEHAAIVHDEKSDDFTLVSEGNTTVNNRAVSGNRKLKDGDVVNIEGTTIVFDAGAEAEKSE